MAKTYTIEDMVRLAPKWDEVFGEPMSIGFDVQPEQVPILERCIAEKSRAPLDAYIATLDPGTSY